MRVLSGDADFGVADACVRDRDIRGAGSEVHRFLVRKHQRASRVRRHTGQVAVHVNRHFRVRWFRKRCSADH